MLKCCKHLTFVNISLAEVIDTWLESSSQELEHKKRKNLIQFSKMVEIEFWLIFRLFYTVHIGRSSCFPMLYINILVGLNIYLVNYMHICVPTSLHHWTFNLLKRHRGCTVFPSWGDICLTLAEVSLQCQFIQNLN